MITQEQLQELFTYQDGLLIRKTTIGRRARKGDIAGCLKSTGYIYIGIEGETYAAHSLIWFY
jgi:hypothetical protein